jgi:MFS family permease
VQGRIEESPEFRGAAEAAEASARPPRSPVFQLLARHPREVLLAAGSTVGNNGNFYLLTTFAIAYGTASLHLPRPVILWAVLLGCLVAMAPTVYAGALSDRFGRRAVYIAGGLLGGLGAFLVWRLIDTGVFALMFLGLTLGYLANTMMYAPQPALYSELFPIEFRYSGASISYQLGAILGGGFAPMIATALMERFHASVWIAGYAALLFAISLGSVMLLPKTSKA